MVATSRPTLKLMWAYPGVTFKGKGIAQAWGEEMVLKGWETTTKVEEADCVIFSSDSTLKGELIGKAPTILFFWGWMPARLLDPHFQKWAASQLKLMAQCTRILVPGLVVADQLADFGLSCELCLPGVDARTLDRYMDLDTKRSTSQIMFISRLEPHKGLDLLLEAAALLEPKPPLLVCGPGDKQLYVEKATAWGLEVRFEELSDEQKVKEIRKSLVLVHPSTYEGMGLPPLEALYCGTPVAVMDIPQMRWSLQEDAYYFSNVEGLARTIAHISSNPDEAYSRANRARKRIADSLTLEKACDRLWAHIHQTIKEHLAMELREHPERWKEIYDKEHRRNWAYGGEVSPPWAAGPARFNPTWERHWRAQEFISALKECKAERILDVGCGAVYPTIFARAGFEVTALDISKEALRQVREIGEKWEVGDRIHERLGDAMSLPFLDSYFDAVVQGEILEHVPDPGKVVSEGMRVLKPGGHLVISTPIGGHHHDPMHLHHWNDNDIAELIKPWENNIVRMDKIAEDASEPSCYLVVLKKISTTSHPSEREE